jgi:hypothetical protein
VTYSKIGAFICPSESIKQGPWPGVSSFISYAANYGGPASNTDWNGVIVPMNVTTSSICQCFADLTGYRHTNFAPFGTEGVTDGTSNTALFRADA